MATQLDKLMADAPDSITLTDDYNTYMESLVTYLKNDGGTRLVSIAPETGYLYRFDLTGFLLDNSVPLEDHRLVMRMNGLNSINDMDETRLSLLVPDPQTINRLKQIYRTTLTVS